MNESKDEERGVGSKEELTRPDGSWLVTLGRNKVPIKKFGGWPYDEASGRNADWEHSGTYNLEDENLNEVAEALEEANHSVFLLDIDGANLLVLDHDIVDKEEEPDIAAGKWPSAESLEEHVLDEYPGQTLWRSKSGGVHVPILLTDEAHEQVWKKEWRPGYGVDSLKGPSARGYTAAPLSPGYEVIQQGGFPTWGVGDIERSECLQRSGAGAAGSREPEEFTPILTRNEAHSLDSTDSMDELLASINQLTPSHFDVPFPYKGKRSDGIHKFDPTYRTSKSGETLVFIPEKGIWYDQSESKGMFSDKLVALEMGLITSPHDTLEGSDWWEAVDRLRELGAPVPTWDGDGYNVTADLDAHEAMARGGNEQLLWGIRNEFGEQLRLAVEQGRNGHVVGPKGVGKTFQSVRMARDHKVAVFAPTKQKYREIIEEAEEQGVSVLRLPSFPEHSPLWDEWEDEYLRGAFPREIYNWDSREFQEDEYKRRQNLDFDDFDLLVGAPQHAFVSSVVEDRTIFYDDADLVAYRDKFDASIQDRINRLLTRIESRYGNWKRLIGGEWEQVEGELIGHLRPEVGIDGEDVWSALDEATEEVQTDIDRREFLARLPGVSLDIIDWMRALTGDLHSSGASVHDGRRPALRGRTRNRLRRYERRLRGPLRVGTTCRHGEGHQPGGDPD